MNILFKVLSEIRSDISNRKNQLQVHLTELKTHQTAENSAKNQKVPTLHKVEKVQLDKPMVFESVFFVVLIL